MKILRSHADAAALETPLLVVLVADKGGTPPALELLCRSEAVQTLAGPVLASGDVTGKFAEPVWLLAPIGVAAKRVLLLGAGKLDKLTVAELRKLAGAAARAAKSKKIKSLALLMPTGLESAPAAQAAAEGVITGNFDVDTYQSERKDLQLTGATLLFAASTDAAGLDKAIADGTILGESQNLTRSLALEPSNFLTPTILAERARTMCHEAGLACEVYGPEKMKELKMGSFLSVAQGSAEEPRLVVMRYEPASAPQSPILGLVGKGITFDSGGISLKPAENMEKMKYDMSGAATMIGAMRAIALLKPKVRVIAVLCATENMPDGKAQKPGDVQFAMNGKSIEVINTDAEGRLVLADGLCYARQLGATHLIDAATLTGAVVVALGYHNVGIFSNNEQFAADFSASAARTGERMWRMPLEQDYFEQIRSEIADIKNTGGRYGGAITAAMFLQEFVSELPWIHLDIAGTAWLEEAKAWMPKGPSGVCVRSLADFACRLPTLPK